jgi:uncharacterized membrane protein YedE/YeeE
MAHLDSGGVVTIAILLIVFTAGTIIPITVTWLQQRTKVRAIEMLKIYAERGEEPPASVLDAVNRINWPFPPGAPGAPNAPPPPKPLREQPRREHLMHLAGNVGLALGSGVVIWWLAHDPQPRLEWLMITAIFACIFFAASGAARLVGALTAPADGRQ